MLKTANKISFLIESQLPDFINEEYELFGKFIQKYYEQLEIQGQPLDIIQNIQTYRDIDFYEKNILNQKTNITTFIQSSDTSITVSDATSFPKNGGYIKIDDEICFYKSRTDTEFLEISRGVSGNTKLGDLYESTTFITTQAADHVSGSEVLNISNLFLYSIVKSFESQYLVDFPEAYLKGKVDKRTLIKNIGSFYKSKGTDSSIRFLFKCLIDLEGPEPEVFHPRDFTLKSSESRWVNVYALKAKITSGIAEDLVGKKIEQKDGIYASAIVDNVRYVGKYDGEELYEIILAESSVNGQFSIASRTKLTKDIGVNVTVGDRVNVFSTMGWDKEGKFIVGGETFTYKNKNVNQFVIQSRTGTGTHSTDASVTYGADVTDGNVTLLVYGVLYNLETDSNQPYLNINDTIEISESGFLTNDIKIFDAQNNLRWITSTGTPAISDLNSNVSAIYEDETGYYIASSGFPSHLIGTLPADAQDQKNLKIIRKNPISTTEIYETKYRDVGIAVNGIPFVSYKDEEVVFNGPLENIIVTARGRGYEKEPYVLVDGVSGIARTKLAGQVVESVIIDTPGSYSAIPTIEILSGRNATATAIVTNGAITSIAVDNAGEYYSSPPEVRITDNAGKGRFADYTAEISVKGELTGLVKVTGGSNYTQGNVIIDIIPVGSGATATAKIKEWRKDKFKNSTLDSDNGGFLKNFISSKGSGYAYYASPTTLRANDTGTNHSPILGFAYDGNPIYGAYGYVNTLDSSSGVQRMTSSYTLNPPTTDRPTATNGTFINDYEYIHGSGTLDENNGRFCVTPEFPKGVYAYFITVDSTDTPVFPYILGENYYSLPVDSNYNSELSQDDLPKNSRILRTTNIDNNGDLAIARINDVQRGNVSSATILSSGSNFSVGNKIVVDDSNTNGFGVVGEVGSVKGKSVVSIESQVKKALYVELSGIGYLFDGDTITQANTGATGTIVGDVFSGNKFALSSVSGTFNSTDVLSSNTKVISLILNQDSSYSKGATLSLSDGVNNPVGRGEVLETSIGQNTVKIKVSLNGFVADDSLFLSSNSLIDTTGSRVVGITNLSENLNIFTIQDNVAILSVDGSHGVGVGEKIDIDIIPDDATTTTTHQVTSAIYQEVTVEIPSVARVLSDSGIGRYEILNGGDGYTVGTYTDVALKGGTGTDAKATITVTQVGNYTAVTDFALTDKGTGYKTYDILTVGDSDLGKSSTDEPDFKIRVDHAGFASQEEDLKVDSVIGFKLGDNLLIGSEVVSIKSISGNTLEVIRGNSPADHADGIAVTLSDPGYNLSIGYQINQTTADPTQPTVVSYDKTTQKVLLKYGYGQTLATISELTLSSVFKDESTPDNRIVNIANVTSPQYYFEIDGERSKNIDIKKYYRYIFDTSHSSMNGKIFDISPSINFNLVTPERIKNSNNIDVKIGFGVRVGSSTTKEDLVYNRYYYYDENGVANSEYSYLNVIDDPLQGSKDVVYVTSNKILYSTGIESPHDGSGTITYTSKSQFSVGEINSISITNIGTDYQKIPLVTGVYDNDGNIDTNVLCFLESDNIGVPRSVKILNNGGAFHSDETLSSTFRSNYVFKLSTFDADAFSIGEEVIQKAGGVEVARARVTSWRSNILLVDRVKGIFRENQSIYGLSKSKSALLESISFESFKPSIKTYFDNLGYYKSDEGKISDLNQRITDSFYYQDYSYAIKSKTPINIWRDLIKSTTHPAGFQLFGEVIIESSGVSRMSEHTSYSRVSVIEVAPKIVTIESTKRQITQSIVLMDNLNVEKGSGSVSLDALVASEISGGNVFLTPEFNGAFTNKGNLEGRTVFTMVDKNGNVVKPYNAQALIITLDGILQEPGLSFTVNEDTITFAQPPLGPRTKSGLSITNPSKTDVEGVSFYGRHFEFKSDSLNARYLKKIRNIYQKNGRWIDAANQLERNKQYIQSQTIDYIKGVHPTLAWTTLSTTCVRDIGLIVDAFAHDLRFGGNQKTIFSAEKYYNNGILDYIIGELEPTLEAFEKVKDLAKLAVNNELPNGYDNPDILLDTVPVKCEDVLSALDTLYEVLRMTLTSGPGTVDVGYADFINGENTIFDLYWENGDPVSTDPGEDLFIALSGVLQHTRSYTIDRDVTPNRVVFNSPPIWGQNENTKTLQEPLAVDKFFAHGMGCYERFTINNSAIGKGGSPGPFLIVDNDDNVSSIPDPTFALVFIDGVLQREGRSYNITGPAIRFTRNIFRRSKVDIISLYGREKDSNLTIFDHERNEYFNEITLSYNDGGTNPGFTAWRKWYDDTSQLFQVAYQKVGGVKKFICNLKAYNLDTNQLNVIISGNNPDLDNSSIFFAGKSDFSDEFELAVPGGTVTIEITKDDYSNYQMKRNVTKWLYGSEKGDKALSERRRGIEKLSVGDHIRIDGEDSYREVNKLPRFAHPKTYNAGEEVSNSFFGSLGVTNYSGDIRGVGLSVSATVSGGKITSLDWNKADLQLLYDEGILRPSTAGGYDTTPIIHFVPVDQKGGGAKAEVIVSDGYIVDVVLTDPGSGYEKPPQVVTARQYDLIKQRGRKVDTLFNLKIEGELDNSALSVVCIISKEKGIENGPGGDDGGLPDLPGDGDGDGVHKDYPWADATWSGKMIQITSIIDFNVVVPAPVAVPQEILKIYPTVVTSVSSPGTTYYMGIEIIEPKISVQVRVPTFYIDPIGRRRVDPGGDPIGPGGPGDGDGDGGRTTIYQLGFVDHRFYNPTYNQNPPKLHNMTMRPAFFQWEGAKFMSTGDILSSGGASVSEYTIEEFDRYGFNIGQFESNAQSGYADDGYSFNIGYPTINNYMAQLNTSDLPDENGAGYLATGAIVYADTTNFPTSGTISLGREQITYTSKLSDRFIDCTRGVNGTSVEEHTVGDFLRTAS